MLFGLTNAPATFQSLINSVLREYLDIFVVAYLDDILIYSKTEKEHEQHVKTVLKALQEYGLRLKPEKCTFHNQEVDFLGSIVTTQGIKMDQSRIQAILEWPTPTNITEVQAFLGFANFYRRFIQGYSKLTEPLTAMTKKNTPF